ncbi:ArnT family glycosyltransferase [Micromonospora sp. WMMD708]|uniref:ArnT family glycosyltransferase n=1 Tax=Micromonospora sp. WMMD708 TaxID=3403464 RepID=UPI003BF601DB
MAVQPVSRDRLSNDGNATATPSNELNAQKAVRITAGRVAIAAGLAGLLYRVVLVALNVPPTNSDEGTAGLAAIHIGEGRDWPAFFYGQHYMGTFHSYLAAPLVQIFGAHWWVIRVPALAMYALSLVLLHQLTRSLYTPWFAAFSVTIMAFGSDRIVKDQVIGAGGYSDVAAATAALMAASAFLALRRSGGPIIHLAWGLLAGYIVWTHWLALPYVAVAVVLLGWANREVLTRGRLLLATAGFILGAAPLIWYNLRPGHPNSLSVLLSVSGAAESAPLVDRMYGALLLGLPLSSGTCAPSHCDAWQMWWGPVYLILLIAAAVTGVVSFRRADDQDRRLHAGRLALLAGGMLTIGSYVLSASSALTPVESARYLHYGLISLPAVLWPAWVGLSLAFRNAVPCNSGSNRPTMIRKVTGFVPVVAGVATIGAFTGSVLVASGQLVLHQPRYAAEAAEERQLQDYLLTAGLTRIYTDYWTCNRLAYASAEKIRCAVVDDNLNPGHDRYRPYRVQVEQADRVAYVLPRANGLADTFARSTPTRIEVVGVQDIGGYRVHLCHQRP